MDLLLDGFEALPVSNIVDSDASVRVPVVSVRNGPEPFLSGRIPHLHLHEMTVVNFNCPGLEVHADRAEIVLCKQILCETEQEGGLTGAALPDEDQFVQSFKIRQVDGFHGGRGVARSKCLLRVLLDSLP